MREIILSNDKISIDSGINFGIGVFETILFREKPVFFNYHIGRLKRGLIEIGLGELVEEEELRKEIAKINLKNNAIKILVTEKNIIISNRENPYGEKAYERGFNIKVSKVLRNSTSRLTYIKSINYAENILEKKEAIREGFDEVLFLNEKGYITETSASNIFAVKGDKIFTPKIKDGILDGTVREFIIKNFEVTEKSLKIEELLNMDEVFLTNSLMGIMKVKKISDKYFKSSTTDKIRKIYEDNVVLNGGELIYDR